MTTILYGNGINLLANAPKWENILTLIDSTWDPSHMTQRFITPNTIQYDQLELKSNKNSSELIQQLCDKICGPWDNPIYEHLSVMPNVNYLTTNYDLTLEQYLFNAPVMLKKETFYNLYSYRTKETSQQGEDLYNKGNIWHIHGDIERPLSIILGYDHYCKQIAKIRKYIPLDYMQLMGNSPARRSNTEWAKTSWIDLFFNSNVYILGLGLDYAELDLWWIIDLWARNKKIGKVSNSIVYLDAINSNGKMDMYQKAYKSTFRSVLANFGIEYIPISGRNYLKAYEKCLLHIEEVASNLR